MKSAQLAQTVKFSDQISLGLKKLGRFSVSTASLVAGILLAVLIQAVVSSIYDNF